jgi:hypothetical protein
LNPPIAGESAEDPRQNAGSIAPTRPEGVFIGGDTVLLLQEIVELRERDVAKRIYINNGLRDLKYKTLHARKAQEDFMKACSILVDTVTGGTIVFREAERLQDAWNRLTGLTRDAKTRERQLEDAQSDLLGLENKLFMKEGEFYGRLRGLTREPLVSTTDAPTDDFTTLSSSSASSTSTVSVAHEYYNKVGDINLLKEHLFNFDSEHRRMKWIRDALRKEGQRLDPSSKVFEEQYFNQRKEMIRVYIKAKNEMEELMQSCARMGVEVAPPDLPAVLDNSQRVFTENEVEKGFHKHVSNLDGHTHSQHRIELWVSEVQRSNHINPFKSSVKANEPPIERASPTHSGSEIPGWTIRPVEDYPALSSYNRLAPSTTSDFSTAETEVPEGVEKRRLMMTRQNPNTFDGEAPSRRYSLPALPFTSALASQLSSGTLGVERKGDYNAPCVSCAMDDGSRSLNLPRP